MKLSKHLLILLLILSIISCKEDSKEVFDFKVEHKGALKNIMHKGDISAKADLKTFVHKDNFYALGAIENLKGEIQIFDSKPYNSIVIDSSMTFDNSYDKSATLLVYASVKKWDSYVIPESTITSKDLENFISQTAQANNIKIDKPFPFLLEGKPKRIDWHVINWKVGDTEHSHEKHINSGLHGTLDHKEVEMLGFYSDAHHAIFTHHTTNMHIHFKSGDNLLAGHVDHLTLGKNMVLKLPSTK